MRTALALLRFGACVRCAEPKGMRGESSEHHVFVHRKDGWWRTEQPMMSWSYNENYCGGGMWVLWNDKGPRTIIGIAAGHNCLARGKEGGVQVAVVTGALSDDRRDAAGGACAHDLPRRWPPRAQRAGMDRPRRCSE